MQKQDDKIIIFDWGGVVESHENDCQDLKEAKIRMIKRYNNSLSDQEILDRWTDMTLTGVSMGSTNKEEDIKDWVNLVQKNMDIDITFEEFKKAYEEELTSVKYYKDVVEFAHSLKDKCKIAILSNLMLFDKKRIDDQYDLSKFDYVYLSFELEMRKPNKKIYEYVLQDLNIKPENILFIDDDYNNIVSARECGWNTCQAFGYELDRIKDDVHKFLEEKNENIRI